jgi:3-oxoacyl-[acyl-carrier protein] reductase
MKILTTKIRQNNLAGAFYRVMSRFPEVQVVGMPTDMDIRSMECYEWFEQHSDADAFVNMAGVTDMCNIDDWTFERASSVVSVNLTGAINLTTAFVRGTWDNPNNKTIVHVGSLWSRKAATGGAAYSASKAGLAQYVISAGYELPNRYAVIGLHPANIADTGMSRQVQDNLQNRRGMSKQQVQEIYQDVITAEEVAEEIRVLLDAHWYDGENIYLGKGDKR